MPRFIKFFLLLQSVRAACTGNATGCRAPSFANTIYLVQRKAMNIGKNLQPKVHGDVHLTSRNSPVQALSASSSELWMNFSDSYDTSNASAAVDATGQDVIRPTTRANKTAFKLAEFPHTALQHKNGEAEYLLVSIAMPKIFVDVLRSPVVLRWLVFLFIAWGALTIIFRRVSFFKEKPRGSAHQIVTLVPFVYFSFSGTRLWFFDNEFAAILEKDKVYGYYLDAYVMILTMFAFQIWDFVVTLATPELCKMEHLVHHAVTCWVAWASVTGGHPGFLLYFGTFYSGVAEMSSVPLALVDLFRMNSDFAKAYHQTNEACRVLFAVSFLVLRCGYWPVVCYEFWLSTRGSHAPLLVTLWSANIVLTLMQFYWGTLIIKALIKMMSGDKAGRQTEA